MPDRDWLAEVDAADTPEENAALLRDYADKLDRTVDEDLEDLEALGRYMAAARQVRLAAAELEIGEVADVVGVVRRPRRGYRRLPRLQVERRRADRRATSAAPAGSSADRRRAARLRSGSLTRPPLARSGPPPLGPCRPGAGGVPARRATYAAMGLAEDEKHDHRQKSRGCSRLSPGRGLVVAG
jgi:hypothetical protein